ncbi:BON domain-containing protein [Arenimonas daejeonensis]|uniref:BON domain-containing protein n=1 Tax=Arenimonas daejeonensis TaxID=370777 RepID=UPI0011BE17CE|nr:BON domain-containing protein [Arenimonas daejeonensis]
MKILKTTLLAFAIAACVGACMNTDDNAGAKRNLATTLDDASITAAVKSMLLADERTKGFDINVNTSKGVVTLRGGADSAKAKKDASLIAGSADGVRRVDNRLIVATDDSERRQDADKATASGDVREALDETGDGIDDAWITSKVKTQLLADTEVAGTMIDVDTKANVVTLTGTTPTATARLAAIRIAAGTGACGRSRRAACT